MKVGRTLFTVFLMSLLCCLPVIAGEIIPETVIESTQDSGAITTVTVKIQLLNDTGSDVYNVFGKVVYQEEGVNITSDTVFFDDIGYGQKELSEDSFAVSIDKDVVPSLNVPLELQLSFEDKNGQAQELTTYILVSLE